MSLEVKLEVGCELRYEVLPTDHNAKIELVPHDGTFAEIGGTEMAPGHPYALTPGTSGAVFTWHGCTLRLHHLPHDQVYTAEAPCMQLYAHAHSLLEQRRRAARAAHEKKEPHAEGPRALVCGAPSSGKLTLCKMLVNYAARLDWHVTFADLDITCNSIAVPGTIAAVPVSVPVPFEEGMSLLPAAAFFYGDTNLESKSEELYNHMVGSLAKLVNQRHERNSKPRCGGVIVKAMSLHSTAQQVAHAARAFKIDTIFVVGDDRLHAQLKSLLKREELSIRLERLPRSGGCITKSEKTRAVERDRSIDRYFYGWPHIKLHPHNYIVTNTDEVNVVRLGGLSKMRVQTGLLPVGEKSALEVTEAIPVPVEDCLSNSLVGFSQAQSLGEVASEPVSGFGLVVSASHEKKRLQLLLPCMTKQLETVGIVLSEIKKNDKS